LITIPQKEEIDYKTTRRRKNDQGGVL